MSNTRFFLTCLLISKLAAIAMIVVVGLCRCGPQLATELDVDGIGVVDAGAPVKFKPANVDPYGCRNGDEVRCYLPSGVEVKNDNPPPGTACWCVLPVTG